MNKKYLLLIFLIAVIFRLYDFGSNPPGLYLDEASHGYDAYSLLTTGKDEFGKSWPVLLRSFGTYPPALYTYLTTVPVYFLGLSVIAVRITSLVCGLLLVVLVTAWIGPAVGLIVAVSPVFVFLSRAAFEPNLGLFLLILASALAFRRRLFLSFFIFALSAYAYPAQRFLAPLCVFYFLIRFRKEAFSALPVFIIASLPLWLVSFTSGASSRLSTLSVSHPSDFLHLFMAYLSPANLFQHPDPDLQRSFPGLSVFYWWLVIPFFLGLYQLFSHRRLLSSSRLYLVLLGLVSLLPGAVTHDYFATLRVLPFFLLIAWIISRGVTVIATRFRPVYLCLILLACIDMYPALVLLKHERSTVWNYEYAQLSRLLASSSLPVVVDNSRQQPVYILLAFYLRFPPEKLQAQYTSAWQADYYSHPDFTSPYLNQIYFHPIDWTTDVYRSQLLVGDSLSVSPAQQKEHFLHLVTTVPDVNGQPVLYVFRTDPLAKCAASKASHETLNSLCPSQL